MADKVFKNIEYDLITEEDDIKLSISTLNNDYLRYETLRPTKKDLMFENSKQYRDSDSEIDRITSFKK